MCLCKNDDDGMEYKVIRWLEENATKCSFHTPMYIQCKSRLGYREKEMLLYSMNMYV